MRRLSMLFVVVIAAILAVPGAMAQGGKKKVLVFGMAKGFHHDSIANAMGTVWKLGKESGVWDTEIYTDPDVIRKPAAGKPGGGFTPLNLYNFDAVVFASSTGETPLNDQQKKDLMSFIHEDGKGFRRRPHGRWTRSSTGRSSAR